MKRIWLFILAGLLLLTGLGILLYPNLNRLAAGFTDQEKIVHFREEQKETDGEDAPYADLLTQMQDYNKEIYENGQEDLKDVWSYEQNPFDFDTAGLADDIDAVKIVPGQDMLTLITCHPYTQNYQRYVVYCRRTDHGEGTVQSDGENDPLAAFDGVAYVSSADDIRREQLVNTAVMAGCAALCLFILMAVCVWAVGGRKRRKRKMHAKRERRKGRRNG